MKTNEFQYISEAASVPHDPAELRGKSRDSGRMVVLNRSTKEIEHTNFSTICHYLRRGDVLVLNDSYLLPNTLWFEHENQSIQLTVYGHESDGTSIVEVKSDQILAKSSLTMIASNDRQLRCTLLEPQPDRLWKARFEPTERLVPALEQHGHRLNEGIPINSTLLKTTPQTYRSVFAKSPGSLQIPSAGLHFSSDLLAQAVAKGVEIAYITLHVGATEIFLDRHITEEDVENHKVRSEYFKVGDRAIALINQAQAEGRRVIAIGTTVMRTLESLAINKTGATLEPREGWTDLYIYPGFKFAVVDMLLTNLHAPISTHLVLTAAFAGKDLLMQGYDEIVNDGGYEFDMFGDSMLIV